MAQNDVILLDGIVDQRLAEHIPSNERDEVFEYLVLEELLKDYDLSNEEIASGWIDGQNDGGLDGAYILINGHLLEDAQEFVWPKSNACIDIWLVTCKHHETFQQAPLDSILATIQEVFNLRLTETELKGSYSEDLLAFRSLLHLACRRLSIGHPLFRFNIAYASRGDTTHLGESVAARGRQIENVIGTLFSSCSAHFCFFGATELIQMHRKAKTFSIDLPFLEHLATKKDSYVLLVSLKDYWKFVSDENGNLRRYLFDSNVRDYLGINHVNDDIARSLADATAPDFWWLNNGVTILATNATIPGKTIQLQNIQIVNGLQTTETIFRHFSSGEVVSTDRALLVKIIVSSDAQVRDRIIRATNNQSPVELAALHATDKIQRDIEEILERNEWYYERRKNYFRNVGKPQARFVTPMYLASAVVALVFKNPTTATRLRSKKVMRTQQGYDSVFSGKFPIEIWPIIVSVYKNIDSLLASVSSPHNRGERFLSNWRPLVSLLIVARRLKTFDYSPNQLLAVFDIGEFTANEVRDAWELIYTLNSGYKHVTKVKASFALTCCNLAADNYGLSGREVVGRRAINIPATKRFPEKPLTLDFVNTVEAVLPKQPWKPGVHMEIANKIGCNRNEVSAAIQQLIAEGRCNTQCDGVVYDSDGKILAIDEERVSDFEGLSGETEV